MRAPGIVPLITADKIAGRVAEMAREIAEDSPGPLVMVIALEGAATFGGDLKRALEREGVAASMQAIRLSSYGQGTVSPGAVEAVDASRLEVAGADVLFVDDILDSGHTLARARAILRERGARRVRAAVFLDKKARRKTPEQADYAGFAIGDVFVVGYGMDLAGRHRELPFIGTVKA